MAVRRARAALAGAASRVVWSTWQAAVRIGTIKSGRPLASRFASFGDNSAICFPVASLLGEDRISVGSDTVIGPYSTVSAGLPGQPPNPWWASPTLVIGDRCVIGRNATITAHQELRIGNDVWTGNGVFISDQNHGWEDPSTPIGQQASAPEPVWIGDGAWIGHGASVLPGVRVGSGSVIGAGAVVTSDVPDRAIAAGVPARVVRHLDPGESQEIAAAAIVPLA